MVRRGLSMYQKRRRDNNFVGGSIAAATSAAYRAIGKAQARKKVTYKAVKRSISKFVKRKRSAKKKIGARKKTRFRKAVKKIISNEEQKSKALGHYNKHYGIDILNDISTVNNERWVQGGMRGTGNAGLFSQYALSFTPFSVFRCLDAASVIFNGKTPAVDPTQGTNQLDFSKTKIDVKYASYAFTLRNISQFEYDYEIWEATNKSNTDDDFWETLRNKAQGMRWVGNAAIMSGSIPAFTFGTGNAIDWPLFLKPSYVEGLSEEYSFKKVKSGQMLGGETVTYFVAKKDFVVDCAKSQSPSLGLGASLCYYAKGDRQVFVRLRPKLSNIYDGSGSYASHITRNYNAQNHIIGEVHENFKMLAPENAPDGTSVDTRALYIDFAQPGSVTGQQTRLTPYATNNAPLNPVA